MSLNTLYHARRLDLERLARYLGMTGFGVWSHKHLARMIYQRIKKRRPHD